MNRHLIAVLLGLAAAAGCHRGAPPSHIFHNGRIVTVDPQFRIVEAMAIRDGRVVAVGTNTEIVKLAGSGTQQVDLGGKTVLPGLIDSHVHAPSASMYEFEQPVPDMQTIEDVLTYVRARAEKTEPGHWITLSQVFITRLDEQRYPTRAELDNAAPRHPVVFRTGPDASLSSMALSMSGIDDKFQVPNGEPCRVERDRSGRPTGILRNCARYIRTGPETSAPTAADRLARLRELLADYNSVGITSIVDGNADREGLELYRTLLEKHELTCRTFMAYGVDGQAPMDRIEASIRDAASQPLHQRNDMLWLRGIKVFLDGGMLTGSAYMRQPWGVSKIYSIDDPAYRGVRFIEPEKLYQIAKLALANDLQFTAHSQGDAAVDAMVDTYRADQSRRFPRPRKAAQHHACELHERGGHRQNEGPGHRRQPAAGVALSGRHDASAALRRRAARLLPSLSHAVRTGGDGRWRLRSHAENRQPPVDQSVQPISWNVDDHGPAAARSGRAAPSRAEPDETAGDPSLHDQQCLPDLRGGAEGIARGWQTRRFRRYWTATSSTFQSTR